MITIMLIASVWTTCTAFTSYAVIALLAHASQRETQQWEELS